MSIIREGSDGGQGNACLRGQKWILDHGGATSIPSWGVGFRIKKCWKQEPKTIFERKCLHLLNDQCNIYTQVCNIKQQKSSKNSYTLGLTTISYKKNNNITIIKLHETPSASLTKFFMVAASILASIHTSIAFLTNS